ncbi:MAG: response regulator transcription factor [Pirellulaceae bacterium]
MYEAARPAKVLVIEDDVVLSRNIQQWLAESDYVCSLASDAAAGVKLVESEDFSVVIIDLTLEGESGLAALRQVREANQSASVLILTPLEYRQERLAGLEAGADDFLLKPFTLNELQARVEAALLRLTTRPKSVLEVGPLLMDLTSRKALRNGRPLALTPTESRILEVLMRRFGTVVTRSMLSEFLWQPEWAGVTNVIEVHINRLRAKLSNGGVESQMIFTPRGSGYVLRWNPDLPPPPASTLGFGRIGVWECHRCRRSCRRRRHRGVGLAHAAYRKSRLAA